MENGSKSYLSFSARNYGNCESIAKYLMNVKIKTLLNNFSSPIIKEF